MDGFIKEFFDGVALRFSNLWTDLWAPISDAWPLWWSWGVFGLIVIGCVFLAYFLQFKWVRLTLLVVIALAAAWLTGRHTMYNTMKAKLDAERARKLVKPRETPPTTDTGWPWKW